MLADLLKKSAGSGLLGLGGGSKFGGLDVKRVYFGSVVACTASLGVNGLIVISGHRNWLRDYSQAVDIAGLKQVQLQTILNIVTVLGFLVSARPHDDIIGKKVLKNLITDFRLMVRTSLLSH